MGRSRGRCNLAFIANAKSRNTTFLKRSQGLKKKIRELSILCDIDACMVIYGGDFVTTEPKIWPEDSEKVRKIIEKYQHADRKKTEGVAKYFQDEKKKTEEELVKLGRNSDEMEYAIWDDQMDTMPEDLLRKAICSLDSKIAKVNDRIHLLKGKQQVDFNQLERREEVIGYPVYYGGICSGVLQNQNQMGYPISYVSTPSDHPSGGLLMNDYGLDNNNNVGSSWNQVFSQDMEYPHSGASMDVRLNTFF